jgi:hypothetical protein
VKKKQASSSDLDAEWQSNEKSFEIIYGNLIELFEDMF